MPTEVECEIQSTRLLIAYCFKKPVTIVTYNRSIAVTCCRATNRRRLVLYSWAAARISYASAHSCFCGVSIQTWFFLTSMSGIEYNIPCAIKGPPFTPATMSKCALAFIPTARSAVRVGDLNLLSTSLPVERVAVDLRRRILATGASKKCRRIY